MKNRKYTLLSVLIGITTLAAAQEINWGPEYTEDANASIHKIIGYDANGFYVTKHTNPSIVLEKYDFSGNKLFAKNLNVNDEVCKNLFYMKDNMMLATYSPSTKTASIFKVNSDGSMDQNKADVGVVDKIDVNQEKSLFTADGYQFAPSFDKTVLLAYFRGNNNKIKIKAIKEDLTILWGKDVEFPLSGDFDIMQAGINGTKAYFLAMLTKEKDNTEYALITVDNNGSVKETPLTPDGVTYISSYNFKLDSLGDIVFSGFYQTKPSANGSLTTWAPIGYFVMRVDGNSGQVSMNKSAAFDEDLVLKYRSQKKLDHGIGSLNGNLTVRNVIENADKSQLIIGEIYSASSSQSTSYLSNGSMSNIQSPGSAIVNSSAVDYMFNDIILFKINPDGSQAWCLPMVKKQESFTDWPATKSTFSFGYYILGSTMYLIYNDNKKNTLLGPEEMEKQKDNIKTAEFGSLALMSETVDLTNGSPARKILGTQYEGDKEKSNVYAADCFQAGNKIIIYRYSEKKKIGQFGQIVMQ